MALVFMEGFDALTASYVTSKYPLGAYFGPDVVTGRYGGQGFRPGPGNQNGELVISTGGLNASALGAGIKMSLSGFSTGINFIRYNTSAGNRQFTIGAKSDGTIVVAAGTSLATPLASSAAGAILSDTWFYIEVELTISDTVGACTVYINGSSVLTVSGVDTKGSTTTVADEIRFTMSGTGAGGITIDDIYLTNTAARLGESRITTLVPTADTADKDWGRSTGSDNYALVDELPFVTTDYVTSATVGDLDLYDFGNLPYTPLTIHAVQTSFFAAKDDAATRAVRARLRSGGTDANGTALGLSATHVQKQDLYLTDPNTSAAWTASAVNALQAGPETTV